MNTQSDGSHGKNMNNDNNITEPPPCPATEENKSNTSGNRTELVTTKSAIPIFASAAVWIVSALFFPMYHMYHYLIIFGLSIAVAVILNKVIPPKKEYVEIPEAPPDTGNANLDTMITEIRSACNKLESVKNTVEKKHPEVSAVISDISRITMKISASIEEKPKNLPLVRRFMNYYLPTTLKLAEKYNYLDSYNESHSHNESGLANIDATMKNIEDALKTVSTAMKKQLDALFEDDALDISTDIEVLESMLSRDGLK